MVVLYRLDDTVAIPALTGLAGGLIALIAAHIEPVRKKFPGIDAELDQLKLLSDAAAAADEAWEAKAGEEDDALDDRKNQLDDALPEYGAARFRVQLIAKTNPRVAPILRSILKGCPPPSDLKPADVPAAMKKLINDLTRHRAKLSRAGVDDSLLANLTTLRQNLQTSVDARVEADHVRGEFSAYRDQARIDLVAQLRLVEGAATLGLPAAARAGLRTLRSHHLPSYSRSSDEPAPPADAPSGGDEPAN